MTDLLRKGSQWLQQQRTACMASPVEYLRAGQQAETVQATFGKTDFEITDGYGAAIASHMVDFLILAEELGFDPKPGDVITADGRKYEVMNHGDDGCWRWSDPFRQTYRIHTKDTGNAD